MQTKDIAVGTDYAYDDAPRRYDHQARVGTDRVARARVVEPPAHGEVEVKVYWDGAKRATGTRRVKVRNLVATWAEHTERKQAREQARTEDIAAMRAAHETLHRLLPARFFDNGDRPEAEHDDEPGALSYRFDATVHGDGSYSTEDRISIHDLADLVQAAYDKGASDAQNQEH